MGVLARLGRGVFAVVLDLVGGLLVFAGYWELGGLHGWNEGIYRIRDGGMDPFGWVLAAGGVLLALFGVAARGKPWRMRWLAPWPTLVGVALVLGVAAELSKHPIGTAGRTTAIVGAALTLLGLAMNIVGGALSGPARAVDAAEKPAE